MMAKYTASPFYSVQSGKTDIRFNYVGEYETNDSKEISILDALCPTWIKRVAEEPTKESQKGGKSSAK